MQQKLITFAVPCYNSAAYMRHCIETLLSAGEQAEIILVDDGSVKDETPAICDEYAAKYPTIVKAIHQENGGHCIALDDGEECVCVQSISYSLLCRWFRAAVLPLDRELETALFHRLDAKRCAVCGALFTPGSNRAKYCPECAGRMKRIKAAQRKRKQREKCHALGAENPL